MGLRITTWNVNGIRNPFGYQPWRDKKTFAAMFDLLEADIVILQETKIQRKDLQDDMVLVPGWDVYFSLPKHKKGYSGVVIYTRSSVCAPIRAEEGITGVLCPPMSSTSFLELPAAQRIGGYPTIEQYDGLMLDAATLDSEGRCVILEFPAFVLIGTYCPANRDETRDEFRIGFLQLLDARIRNLTALGKRVVLAGDINIIRDEMDTAGLQERLRKEGVSVEDFFSTPARKLFNQLLEGGKVFGSRDSGREHPMMVDVCREFHPERKGMFTCWDTKKNTRPANFGSRIDYICASIECKGWFSSSDIQEGLMGSDHCPVYADIKDKVVLDGKETDIGDVMNPPGMFVSGVRQREWTVRDLLPISAKLIPEFDRRQSIRDMFMKKPAIPKRASSSNIGRLDAKDFPVPVASETATSGANTENGANGGQNETGSAQLLPSPTSGTAAKRSAESPSLSRPTKKSRATSSKAAKPTLAKGQSSLHGFFKPKPAAKDSSFLLSEDGTEESENKGGRGELSLAAASFLGSEGQTPPVVAAPASPTKEQKATAATPFDPAAQADVIDPIVAKESWGKLLGKRVVPRCEHNEKCISLVTKKPGINCGRSFYICPRPLGPTGEKEKGTEWRCGTFIWSSDWKGDMSQDR